MPTLPLDAENINGHSNKKVKAIIFNIDKNEIEGAVDTVEKFIKFAIAVANSKILDGDLDDYTIIRYISRMKYRATPFKAFSASFFGGFSKNKVNSIQGKYVIYVIDPNNKIRVPKNNGNMRIFINPTLEENHSYCKLKYYDSKPNHSNIVEKIKVIKKSFFLENLLKILKNQCDLNEIMHSSKRELNINYEKLFSAILELKKNHIIHTERHIIGLEKRFTESSLNKNYNHKLQREFNLFDTRLVKERDIETILQTDQNYTMTYNEKKQLEGDVNFVLRYTLKEIDQYKNIRRYIMDKTNGYPLPLLDIIQECENNENSLLGSNDISNKDFDPIYTSFLIQEYALLTGNNTNEIQFRKYQQSQKLEYENISEANGYALLSSFNDGLELVGCGMGSGLELINRYFLDPEIVNSIRNNLFNPANSSKLPIDVLYSPTTHVFRVLKRHSLFEAGVHVFGDITMDKKKIYSLDDIFLSVQNNEIVVHGRNREVLWPLFTSPHDALNENNNIAYRLLAILSRRYTSGFYWPKCMMGLSRLPRVLCGNTIISRAKWKLPETFKTSENLAIELKNHFRNHKMPRWMTCGQSDKRLVFDSDDLRSIKSSINDIINSEWLEESHQNSLESAISVNGAPHSYELVVPFTIRGKKLKYKDFNLSKGITGSVKISDKSYHCLYYKIYPTTPKVGEKILFEIYGIINELTCKNKINKWFFIRYWYPSYHIRLRVFSSTCDMASNTKDKLRYFLSEHAISYEINKYENVKYEREIVRYGGMGAIDLCEKIFHADSECYLICSNLIKKFDTNLSEERIKLLVAAQSISSISNIFWGKESIEKLSKICSSIRGEIDVNSLEYNGYKSFVHDSSILKKFNKFFCTSMQHEIVGCYSIFKANAKKLTLLSLEDALTNTYDDIIYSILHMTCNRNLRNWNRTREYIAFSLAKKITFMNRTSEENYESK